VVCRATGEWLELEPRLLAGEGGEARVFGLRHDPERVAKVYRHPDPARRAKIEAMVAQPPVGQGAAARGVRIAWPTDVLLDEAGAFAGFVMRRAEGPRLFELYNPATRRVRAPECDYATLHRAGWNLAAAFEALHAAGYVVGDVNESNLLVSETGGVTLVDTDSFQVPAAGGGAAHRCKVGKPEFTPPELQGVAFDEVERTPAHDRFGLGVLLFQLLMEGTHPFAGRFPGLAEAPPVAERIREGWFPYRGMLDLTVVPPRLAPPPEVLHPVLRRLFHRCFVDGHHDPAARPTAREWREALAEARIALVVCPANPRHRHGPHLLRCPWCDRAELLGGRDPFPGEPGAGSPAAGPALPVPVAAATALATGGRKLLQGLGAPAPAAAVASGAQGPGTPAPWYKPELLVELGLDNGWAAVSGLSVWLWLQVDGGGRMIFALAALVCAMVAYGDQRSRGSTRTLGPALLVALGILLMLGAVAPILGAREEDDPPIEGPLVEAAPVMETAPEPPVALEEPDGIFVAPPAPPTLPRMLNRKAVMRGVKSRLPRGFDRPDARATLTFRIRPDGRVEPWTITVLRSDDDALAAAAERAYAAALFEGSGEEQQVVVSLRGDGTEP
jgi:tRNA A-37 threonylcarbamoyl transferase component Bud32